MVERINIYVVDTNFRELPPLVRAKLLTEKHHTKEKLNRILMTVIDIQRKHFNYINHYLPDPSMWLDILADKTVHHYINRVRSKALELPKR